MQATVYTSSNGGLSADDVAEMCVNKLISVSDTAPPEIALQAKAYRQQMLEVVARYVKIAITEDRATVAAKIEGSGMPDLAQQIRRL